MKGLLFVLALLCVTQTAHCCSCVEGAFNRPSSEVIRDDFCFSNMVYSARVVGATCSCITNINTTLNCVNYGYTDAQESTGLNAEIIAIGECEGAMVGDFSLDMCANLNQALSVNVDIMPGTNLTPINLTALTESRFCPNVCPFNLEDPNGITAAYPCQYTVEIMEVFRPQNYTGATTITVIGPDVLTSCGNPGRRLSIGETYLAGVGGGCNPIDDWSTLESYSTDELNLLRGFRDADIIQLCGALVSVPSLITITLSVLFILVLGQI